MTKYVIITSRFNKRSSSYLFLGCDIRVDLVLILDLSGSVEDEYRMVLEFAKHLVYGLPFQQDRTRVGAIAYSTEIVGQFYMNTYRDQEAVINALNFYHKGGKTNAQLALNLMREQHFTSQRGDRSAVRGLLTFSFTHSHIFYAKLGDFALQRGGNCGFPILILLHCEVGIVVFSFWFHFTARWELRFSHFDFASLRGGNCSFPILILLHCEVGIVIFPFWFCFTMRWELLFSILILLLYEVGIVVFTFWFCFTVKWELCSPYFNFALKWGGNCCFPILILFLNEVGIVVSPFCFCFTVRWEVPLHREAISKWEN